MNRKLESRGEAILGDAEHVRDRLKALAQATFRRSDLSGLIEPFVSRLEYFMKAIVFPSARRRETLFTLIEALACLGAQSTTLEALHQLRELNNTSKHDPDTELKWRQCVDALSGAVNALKDISELGLAAVDAPFAEDLSSVLYLGFWDHFTGGETEVGLYLPSDHWLGTLPISTFHLPISSWEHVKPLLVDHPRYERGEKALGEDLWKSFSEEDDFLDAGIWEGDVRELLMLLSSFNDDALESAVIPFLARRNDLLSVGIALASAAVDVARTYPHLYGEALRLHVTERAKEYAADVTSPTGQMALDAVTELLASVPEDRRVHLDGPAFRRIQTEASGQISVPLCLEGTTFVWLIR